MAVQNELKLFQNPNDQDYDREEHQGENEGFDELTKDVPGQNFHVLDLPLGDVLLLTFRAEMETLRKADCSETTR